MVTCNQMVQGAVADVTLAGALVTFSPASSARDGGAGAFIGDEVLLVISGIFVGTTLAFADVILAPDLVFSPASSARDGGAGAFMGDEVLLVLSGVMPVAILRQIATEPKMHGRCSESAFVTLDGALVTFVI